MLHAGETNESANYIPFSITAAGNERVTPKTANRPAGPDRDAAARELNVSGPQLAVRFVFFLGAAKLLMWALVKLWLFEG